MIFGKWLLGASAAGAALAAPAGRSPISSGRDTDPTLASAAGHNTINLPENKYGIRFRSPFMPGAVSVTLQKHDATTTSPTTIIIETSLSKSKNGIPVGTPVTAAANTSSVQKRDATPVTSATSPTAETVEGSNGAYIIENSTEVIVAGPTAVGGSRPAEISVGESETALYGPGGTLRFPAPSSAQAF